MADEAFVKDPSGAAMAASRLSAELDHLNTVASAAAGLIGATEALSPLWGDDQGGRLFRHNYSQAGEQVRLATIQLTAALAELALTTSKALESIVDADDPRAFRI
jgi:hypothetical protein